MLTNERITELSQECDYQDCNGFPYYRLPVADLRQLVAAAAASGD